MCLRWLIVTALASGCLHDELVLCGDELCPKGYGCDTDRSICALPNGLSIPTKAAIDHAFCGQPSAGVLTIRNLSSNEIAYSTIISDIGVTVTPASGSFSPGDTDLQISTTVPVESLPGQVISGSLFVPLDDGTVVKRPLKVTPTGAALDVSTHSLSFGESAVATTTMKTVTYTNTGNVAVTLAAMLQPSSAFAFASSPTVHLEPGDSQSIGVTFASNVVQMYTSSLAVTPDVALCQRPLDLIPLDGAATTDAILLDSLKLDFADASCNQPRDVLPLTVTNTNMGAQDVTFDIKGTDAGLFASSIAMATVPGKGMLNPLIARNAIGFTTPGLKTATLGVSASLDTAPLITNKSVTLVQNVVAPVLTIMEPCIDVTTIAPHSFVNAAIHVTNTGNATAAVTIATPAFPVTSVSPSQPQIAPMQTVKLTYTITNPTNFNIDVTGTPLGVIGAANACSRDQTVMVCGNPI